ncbi:hypothetical protein EYF80_050622 [Liparis tanakae]|uniref:Uncharacterized protein n=1 Tax=Liparis tanakae TaxID=230148 RepID=A0A4Z2FEK6_9TELE|nr:hypothetical protein EYF80_050622 [Liparis tanakae]
MKLRLRLKDLRFQRYESGNSRTDWRDDRLKELSDASEVGQLEPTGLQAAGTGDAVTFTGYIRKVIGRLVERENKEKVLVHQRPGVLGGAPRPPHSQSRGRSRGRAARLQPQVESSPSRHARLMALTTPAALMAWELQARKAAASSRCRTAPVRFLRTGLLSMVRRVTATQPVLGKVLCC